jgi:hypothetical protein
VLIAPDLLLTDDPADEEGPNLLIRRFVSQAAPA